MATSDTFGWDLLYKVTEPQIRTNQDVIICLTHWKLIHQGFRCVGVGEDTTQPNPSEESELLPEGWNSTLNRFTLRYVHNSKLYLFNAIINENKIIINMNRVVDNQATATCIDVDVVKERNGPLAKLIPNYDEIIATIKKELIDPMLAAVPSKEVHTQTTQETSTSSFRGENKQENYFIPLPQRPHPQPTHPPMFANPLRDLGRADLDPFSTGGGMLFEPPGFGPRLPDSRMGGLPRGAVPPGARFDPFMPPGNLPPRRFPDSDHLPPPGYDDMFM